MNLDNGSTVGGKGILTTGNHGRYGNFHPQYSLIPYFSKSFVAGDVNNYVKIFETIEVDDTVDSPQFKLELKLTSIGSVNNNSIDGTIRAEILGGGGNYYYSATYYCERLGSTGFPGLFVLQNVPTTGSKRKFIGYIKIPNTNNFMFIPLLYWGTKYFWAYDYQMNEPKTTKYNCIVNLNNSNFIFFDESPVLSSLEGTTVATSVTENSTNITTNLPSVVTTSGSDTQITVTSNTKLIMLAFSGSSVITTINGGYTGQSITFVGNNNNCSINQGGNIILSQGATSRAMSANRSITLQKITSNTWLETTNNL